MIIQTVVSHTLYHINKNKNAPGSYMELETEWEKNGVLKNILNFKITKHFLVAY
jgi:hypothetical protein